MAAALITCDVAAALEKLTYCERTHSLEFKREITANQVLFADLFTACPLLQFIFIIDFCHACVETSRNRPGRSHQVKNLL